MTATFLVKLDIGNVDDLDMIAEDIMDSLDNFEVISVEPWARPTLGSDEGPGYGGTTLPLF
jgi:hypothetical protein